MTGPWDEITDAATVAGTYTPQDDADNDDRNMYLRAEAAYIDGRGAAYGDQKASAVSAHRVSEARADNTEPTFSQTDVARNIPENTAAGMKIGAPVAATDPDSGDILAYTLGGAAAASFSIDKATGQLMTKANLDFDTTNSHIVEVTATDSSGGQTTIAATVTISIIDIDEAPTFSAFVTAEDIAENAIDLTVGTFTASDPEGGPVTLSLSGADASKFELTGTTAGTRVLAFIESPDFEAKADSDGNNVYEVTVEASDKRNVGRKAVTAVKVTNVNEEGKVTLSGARPVVGVEMTATLADEDGFVPDTVTWTWHMLDTTAEVTADEIGDNAIDKATSAAYTPVADDNGKFLKAKASYADMSYDTIVVVTSDASAKVSLGTENKRPEFDDGRSTDRYVMEGTAAEMDIVGLVGATDPNEDSLAYTLGGTDKDSFSINVANGQLMTKAKLDYEGKKSYTVTVTADDSRGEANSTATITVTIHVTNMDEEPTISDKADSTATELQVVEYDENGKDPVITLTARDPEGVMPIVWSLPPSDVDPDGVGEGSLEDADVADNGDFRISASGVLSFKTSPDFENPADAALADNTYLVVVQATDRGDMNYRNWFKVTVNVTNVGEDGKVTLSQTDPSVPLLQPQVGVGITAAVTDPDGEVTETAWKWYRSSNMTGPWAEITDAATGTYTPQDDADNDDRNMYLRAEATYTDARGADYGEQKASAVSAHRGRAEQEDNTDPTFSQTDVARNILENTAAGMKIGAPVAATDPDSGDILAYTLGGD